jgi:hypothetical protein
MGTVRSGPEVTFEETRLETGIPKVLERGLN